MLVDDNAVNLTMGNIILKEKYKVYPLTSAAKMFELLNNVMPDLIMLDIEMPEMNGYEAMRLLRTDPRNVCVPVVFVTASNDTKSEHEGLALGAMDYITKPFSAPLLLKRIENVLLISTLQTDLNNISNNIKDEVRNKTKQVVALQNAIINTIADMVEYRDNMAAGHVDRIRKYYELLFIQLLEDGIYSSKVNSWDPELLYPSAQLHDIGKIAISDTIINKPGKLSAEEFNEMKRHPSYGEEAIRKIENHFIEEAFIQHARNIAAAHHEKWDGTGYPARLRGDEIPLEGRLMAIVDVYDALISSRPYKKPLPCNEAERVILSGSGSHFDPALVDVFRKVASKFAQVALGYR